MSGPPSCQMRHGGNARFDGNRSQHEKPGGAGRVCFGTTASHAKDTEMRSGGCEAGSGTAGSRLQ